MSETPDPEEGMELMEGITTQDIRNACLAAPDFGEEVADTLIDEFADDPEGALGAAMGLLMQISFGDDYAQAKNFLIEKGILQRL